MALIPHPVSNRRFTRLLALPDRYFDAASTQAQSFILRKVECRRQQKERFSTFGKVGDGTTKLELSDVHRVFRPLAPEKGDVVHA